MGFLLGRLEIEGACAVDTIDLTVPVLAQPYTQTPSYRSGLFSS